MAQTRLSQDSWTQAGLDALRDHGPDALRAEPLARALGTTKGSFYWHFADVPAFHHAVTQAWRAGALSQLSDAVAQTGPADVRLRRFGHAVLADPVEAQMRLWALTAPRVMDTLAQADDDRLTYITLLLREMGLANPDFARAVLATLVGLPQITTAPVTRQNTFDTLVDTVLAL